MSRIIETAKQLAAYYAAATGAVEEWFDDFEWITADNGDIALKEIDVEPAVGYISIGGVNNFSVHCDLSYTDGVPMYRKVITRSCLSEAVCELFDYAKHRQLQAILNDVTQSYEWELDPRVSAIATVTHKPTGAIKLNVIRRSVNVPLVYYELHWDSSSWCMVSCDETSSYYNVIKAAFEVLDAADKLQRDKKKQARVAKTEKDSEPFKITATATLLPSARPFDWGKLSDVAMLLVDLDNGAAVGQVYCHTGDKSFSAFYGDKLLGTFLKIDQACVSVLGCAVQTKAVTLSSVPQQ
jgi:hypothetical protein